MLRAIRNSSALLRAECNKYTAAAAYSALPQPQTTPDVLYTGVSTWNSEIFSWFLLISWHNSFIYFFGCVKPFNDNSRYVFQQLMRLDLGRVHNCCFFLISSSFSLIRLSTNRKARIEKHGIAWSKNNARKQKQNSQNFQINIHTMYIYTWIFHINKAQET